MDCQNESPRRARLERQVLRVGAEHDRHSLARLQLGHAVPVAEGRAQGHVIGVVARVHEALRAVAPVLGHVESEALLLGAVGGRVGGAVAATGELASCAR
jgi:hypothetical protein